MFKIKSIINYFIICSFFILSYRNSYSTKERSMEYIYTAMNIEKNNPFLASEYYIKAIKESPNWDYPYILLGNLYDAYYLIDKSISNYEYAISRKISQNILIYQVYFNLAKQYLIKGEFRHFQKYLKLSKSINPNDKNLKILESIYKNFINLDEDKLLDTNYSIPILWDIIEQKDDCFYAYKLLGLLYERIGDYNSAIKVYKNVLGYLYNKNVVLIGDYENSDRGVFYFIRDSIDSGLWRLNITFPKGIYYYKIIENYGYPDSKYKLDQFNTNVLRKGFNDYVNKLVILDNFSNIEFIYKTFEKDNIFYEFEKYLIKLKKFEYSHFTNIEYIPHINSKKVKLSYYNPNAYSVWIAGTFNNWGYGRNILGDTEFNYKNCWPMVDLDNDGYWEIEFSLLPGLYLYKMIVNENLVVKNPNIIYLTNFYISNYNDIIWGQNNYIYVDKDPDEIYTEFVFNAKNASSVLLAGSFNEWGGTIKDKLLKPEYYYELKGPDKDGNWRIIIPLKKGRYEYKYIINGTHWVNQQGLGPVSPNSIVYVGKKEFNTNEYFGEDNTNGILINFKYYAPEAEKVWIIGDFNEWGGLQYYSNFISGYYYDMKKSNNKGWWEFSIKLPIGIYKYGYSINGKKKYNFDPLNENFEIIDNNITNSILYIK